MTTPTAARTPVLAYKSRSDLITELYRDFQPKIECVPIGAIKAYERNARTHSKKQIGQIAESMKAFGFISPIVVDEKLVIIAGHGRLAAAKLLRRDTVDIIRISHLSDAEKRALRIADNQLAALAGWDRGLLALEFKDLLQIDLKMDLSFGLTITGFGHAEIDKLVDTETRQEGAGESEAPEPDRTRPPVSRLGDHWNLEDHAIVCGDARDRTVYETLLGDERAAMSISDPPYNIPINGMVSKSGKHREFAMGVGEMSVAAFTAFLATFLGLVRAFSKPGAIAYVFQDWRHMHEMLAAGHEAGLTLNNLCIWNKASAGMGGNYRSQHELVFMWKDPTAASINNIQLGKFGRNRTNVWDFPGAAGLRKELELHPTPKPVSLVAEAIRDASNRNDIVLDCFSGSGTTILAAAKTGRRARVIDLDPHYVDVAIERWKTWSGKTAIHAETGLTFEGVADLRARQTAAANNTPPAALSTLPIVPRIRVRPRPPIVTAA